MTNIITTTGNKIPEKEITKILGIAQGNTVRTRNIGRDIGACFKNIIGGEIKTYTEMIKNARDEAYNRMINNAIKLKADAIINIRFTTSMIMSGASEMLAYGTAVKIKWAKNNGQSTSSNARMVRFIQARQTTLKTE